VARVNIVRKREGRRAEVLNGGSVAGGVGTFVVSLIYLQGMPSKHQEIYVPIC
jgi:hypothetical protein